MNYDIIDISKLTKQARKNARFQKINHLTTKQYTENDREYKFKLRTSSFRTQAHAIRLGNESYGEWTFFARFVMHFGINASSLIAGRTIKEIESNRKKAENLVKDFYNACWHAEKSVYLRFPIEEYLKLVKPRRGNSHLDFELLSNRKYAGIKNTSLYPALGDIVRLEVNDDTTTLVSLVDNTKTATVNSYAIKGLRVITKQEIREHIERINANRRIISLECEQELPEMTQPKAEDDFTKMYKLADDISLLEDQIKAKKAELRKLHDKAACDLNRIKNILTSK